MYLKDFNEDGQVDPLITYLQDDKEYPVATRDDLLSNFTFLRSRFPGYGDLAGKTIQKIMGDRLQDDVEVKKAVVLESSYFENRGDGSFQKHSLPVEAQFAPIFAINSYDYDGDGLTDLLLGGNQFDVKPSMGGRYDASYGWFLKGTEDGTFKVSNPMQNGFVVQGEIKDIQVLETNGDQVMIAVARNNDDLLLFMAQKNTSN
jgi:hypothetical protein